MLDWIAGIVELWGKWVVGDKNKWGFVINFACCVLWIIYVFKEKTAYGILVVIIPAMFINVRNFIQWSKDDKRRA